MNNRSQFGIGSTCLLAFAMMACGGADDAVDTASDAIRTLKVTPTEIVLPEGSQGIGFDDFQYSRNLNMVLIPAGRSGYLDLITPSSDVIGISGFSSESKKLSAVTADVGGGHDFGATSVTEGRGRLFVTDRTSEKVSVVDSNTSEIVSSFKLAASPDYIRYVAGANGAQDQVWIAEPDASQIEVLTVGEGASPLVRKTLIPITDGPESLIVDSGRQRAYANVKDGTIAIDLQSFEIIAQWTNGCASSSDVLQRGARGLALDEARGFLFVGCAEGHVSSIDVEDGTLT